VWTYTLGPILAFLPLRWRKEHLPWLPVKWSAAGFFSGLLELAGFFPLLLWWYSYFVTALAQALAQSTSPSGIPEGREGLVGIAGFAMNPITWVVCYVGLEGLFRAAGALAGGEARGTIFLAAPYFVLRKMTASAAKPELPLVRDEVTPGKDPSEIQIAASRKKSEWKYPFTIRYGGAYFQVVGERDIKVGPRPIHYTLRRLPAGEIARGLAEYDPGDALIEKERIQPIEQQSFRAVAGPVAPGSTIRQMQQNAGKADFGMKFILGPFVSLLPQGWRGAVFAQAPSLLAPGAIISGAITFLISVLLLAAWFTGDMGVHWARGQAFLFATLVGYVAFEGLIRAYLGLTTGEVHGIFVFGILEAIWGLFTRPAARPKTELVADEVTPGGTTCDLSISSCREKRDWKYPYAIKYEGTFFQVTGSSYVANVPRPYVYSLRRLQPGEIAGGLKDYTTRDVLHADTVDRVKW
jgi:hypothetical protein